MNVEDFGGSEFGQSMEHLEAECDVVDSLTLSSPLEIKSKKKGKLEMQSFPWADSSVDHGLDNADEQDVIGTPTKTNNPGRPKKSPSISLQVILLLNVILYVISLHFFLHCTIIGFLYCEENKSNILCDSRARIV